MATILIVDDTPANVQLLGEILSGRYRTKAATSGERALRIAPLLPIGMRRKLFKTVHEALGGELRMVLCSAAYLTPALQRNWEALGVLVVQGYGSTEAGLVATNFLDLATRLQA